MSNPVTAYSLSTRGCYSETGHLHKVVMCPPTYFCIFKPINVMQWMYSCDGLPALEPPIMELQSTIWQ
jgi:hypothetical protein